MKTKILIGVLLILSNLTLAQVSGTVTIGDLFKKKKKEKKEDLPTFVWTLENHNKSKGWREYINGLLIKNDTIKLFEALKVRNIDVNQGLDSHESTVSIIHSAAFYDECKSSTLESLLKKGGNPNLKIKIKVPEDNTEYISSSVIESAKYNKEKIKLLIKYGLDLNSNKDILQKIAATSDFEFKNYISELYGGVVSERILIEMATNYNDKQKINPQLIKNMVSKGASVNVRYGNMDTLGNDTSMTLLMYFIENDFSYDNIKALIENGANVNEGKKRSSFENGRFPIHSAIIKNRLDVLKLLVEKGANINALNDNSQNLSPLSMAQKYKRTEMVDYLFMKGAN